MHTQRYNFNRYKDCSFESRFVSHPEVMGWVEKASGIIDVSLIGHSAENRAIYRLSAGNGKIQVLLWSQMHGDESTATLAMMDVLNFLNSDDEHNDVRSDLLQRCTFHFIPMLNPDGAERCQRRNAQGIDINRDFLALQTPEARLLKSQQELIRPEFAFNLHDQDSLWSVTGTGEPALISLLAPPAAPSLDFSPSMRKAIQVIAAVYTFLEEEIPGKTGRWKDEFEPRAVGETFQQAGVSTILIESGGYHDEASKQYVRKLNFDALLHSFKQIASEQRYRNGEAEAVYANIPLNTKEIFHTIVRNCRMRTAGGMISLDIGLNHEAIDHRELRSYFIADIGDLSPFGAYLELDARGSELKADSMETGIKASFRIAGVDGTEIAFGEGRQLF